MKYKAIAPFKPGQQTLSLMVPINVATALSTSPMSHSESSDLPLSIQLNPNTAIASSKKSDAGLAPLLLTVVELIRQLMEAQIIRRMEADELNDADLERAAESLRKLEEQVVHLCEIFDIDPADLNIDLGEIGTLFPKENGYYPGEPSTNPSILELLDRLLNTGIVVEGSVDLGLAQLDLIHAKLKLVLTSKTI
jgi:Gas vesicle protein K/Gas vesicle protein